MRIHVIGGGPAGLYLGILMKRRDPGHEVWIRERNRPQETFGFGVVFSAATLGNLEEADPESLHEIRENFVWWDDIHTYMGGQMVVSTGHGFCGLSRVKLLEILSRRAKTLGCILDYESDVGEATDWGEADVIVAADGVNSRIRTVYAEQLQPTVDVRPCRFIWLGANLKLPAFTFIFRENEAGLFQVHAYPFDEQTSTFIIECTDEVWRKSGLDRMGEAETLAYFQALFADHLHGAKLLTRAGGWRNFPNIHCARWHHQNMVILGDAAHTAHFSIGSGTKLAMEDAIALADALEGPGDVPTRLAAYDTARRPDVEKLQKVARTSQAWFEHVAWFMGQDPLSFSFNLLTRSRRIGYAELQKRDPALLAQVQAGFATACGVGETVPPAFTPFTVGGLRLPNRIVVSPMCQYSAEEGTPNDWHLVHLGSRATGGAGLIIAEATAVSPEGRITPGCTGMYHEDHVAGWKRVTDFVHRHSSAKIGLQIGHAGRKAGYSIPWEGSKVLTEEWKRIAPSALPWNSQSPTPVAMDEAEMDRIEAAFVWSAKAAARAGFDLLELHMAHGYLLSLFLSPLTNLRTDRYGGDVQGRLTYPLQILQAVRQVWAGPLLVRLSTTEWAPGGTTDADRRAIGLAMKAAGADMLDCSTGGVVVDQRPDYGRMFQVPFAEQIRYEAGIPVMAVGAITDVDQINSLVAAGRADLCALARKHLYDPAFALHAAAELGVDVPWPVQYRAAAPAQRKG